MANRDKVLTGLECCRQVMAGACVENTKCAVCPYFQGHDDGSGNPCYCVSNLMKDMQELLTPHVLAINEIHRGMTVWLEDFDKPDVILAIGGSSAVGHKCFIDVLDRALAVKDAEYNIRWRAWTAEPTEEQRAVAKWND